MAIFDIRKSKLSDAEAMLEIERLVWTSAVTPDNIHFINACEYLLKNPVGSKFVATLDNHVVGILGFKPPTTLKTNQHVAELDIAVHPDYQHHGVGQSLICFLKKQAKQDGFIKLQLRVLSTNKKAIHFYKKNGFSKEGKLKKQFFIDGRYVDDIIMAYFLQ